MTRFTSILLIAGLFCFSLAKAQTEVSLQINHKLGDAPFEMLSTSSNNMGLEFQFDRLEYYISNISIQHDGGTSTAVEDLYLLVDAGEDTQVDLGSYDIESIEGITFSIGVDEDVNHGDPSLWAAGHPLAPQNPSMHWGWAAGYRFLAAEGMAGDAMTQGFELHGLGDINYQQDGVQLEATAMEQDGKMLIQVDADYSNVLFNIDVSQGVISHGETGQAKRGVENMVANVFTGIVEEDINVAIQDLPLNDQFSVYPNPSDGPVTFALKVENSYCVEGTVEVLDATGKIVQSVALSSGAKSVEMETSGLYIVQLKQHGQLKASKKVLIK